MQSKQTAAERKDDSATNKRQCSYEAELREDESTLPANLGSKDNKRRSQRCIVRQATFLHFNIMLAILYIYIERERESLIEI